MKEPLSVTSFPIPVCRFLYVPPSQSVRHGLHRPCGQLTVEDGHRLIWTVDRSCFNWTSLPRANFDTAEGLYRSSSQHDLPVADLIGGSSRVLLTLPREQTLPTLLTTRSVSAKQTWSNKQKSQMGAHYSDTCCFLPVNFTTALWSLFSRSRSRVRCSPEDIVGSRADLIGLWKRRSIAYPESDRAPDTTTLVRWLQGPLHYCDLRLPQDSRPPFTAKCLRELTKEDALRMCLQSGFAGILDFSDGVALWHRAMDWNPPTSEVDTGLLTVMEEESTGKVMMETGDGYVENWLPGITPGDDTTPAALVLTEKSTGAFGIAVRVGDVFMYGRDRTNPLAIGKSLEQLVKEARSVEEMQELLDCEISIGSADGWSIGHSSLPFKQGHQLNPVLAESDGGMELTVSDIDVFGRAITRQWLVTCAEGATSHAWITK